jgi:ASC-1-like (ASCH) protein
MDYKLKYIKYKIKYLEQEGGRRKSKKKVNKNIIKNNIDNIKPNYTENVSEPWFSLILLGLKTVEGRKNKGKFKDMKVGDIVEWTNDNFMPRTVLTKITGKAEYPTFREYLETEGLEKCLPGMEKLGIDKGLEYGLGVYFKYYTKEDEKEFGVIAIRMTLIK